MRRTMFLDFFFVLKTSLNFYLPNCSGFNGILTKNVQFYVESANNEVGCDVWDLDTYTIWN